MSVKAPQRLIGYSKQQGCYLNLAGDYDYLAWGYYTSQDLELDGQTIYPTCKEALDAYITPVLLEKAHRLGVSTPEYYISNGYFEPPVIVDAVNPFMSGHRVVHSPTVQERVAKSLTRNFKYMICCQELPPGARVCWFRAVLGHTQTRLYRPLAQQIWNTFHLPLAKVRAVVLPQGEVLLSGVWPLPYLDLNLKERALIDREITWQT